MSSQGGQCPVSFGYGPGEGGVPEEECYLVSGQLSGPRDGLGEDAVWCVRSRMHSILPAILTGRGSLRAVASSQSMVTGLPHSGQG